MGGWVAEHPSMGGMMSPIIVVLGLVSLGLQVEIWLLTCPPLWVLWGWKHLGMESTYDN